VRGVRSAHALDDHRDHQVVGHEGATLHVGARLLAKLAALLPVRAQQVAAGDVRHAVVR
jgi:hypothetical protein